MMLEFDRSELTHDDMNLSVRALRYRTQLPTVRIMRLRLASKS